MLRRSALPALLATFIVSNTAAQAPALLDRAGALRPGPAGVLWARGEASLRPTATREPLGGFLGRGDRDYRYTGFFIGAGLGLASTIFSAAWCSDSDNACTSGRALLLGPVMSGVLGLGGAVIGGLFPKSPRDPVGDSRGGDLASATLTGHVTGLGVDL